MVIIIPKTSNNVIFFEILFYLTIKTPCILLCPEPQYTEQEKGKLPILSALNSTVISWLGFKLIFISKSEILNPCSTSILLIFNFTKSSLLTVIEDGSKLQFLAIKVNSFVIREISLISSSLVIKGGSGTFIFCSSSLLSLS